MFKLTEHSLYGQIYFLFLEPCVLLCLYAREDLYWT